MSSKYQRKDSFYQQAKREGFRSRASYKLQELHTKHRLLRPGLRVVDLGAWPGGWSQVAAQSVGNSGLVVGIDLVEVEPLPEEHVKFICGDVRDDENIDEIKNLLGGMADVLLSDMSPKHTGIREVDSIATVASAELALFAASRLLKKGGSWVAKVFNGNETEEFIREARPFFAKLQKSKLKSTRKTSNELYVIGTGYKGH